MQREGQGCLFGQIHCWWKLTHSHQLPVESCSFRPAESLPPINTPDFAELARAGSFAVRSPYRFDFLFLEALGICSFSCGRTSLEMADFSCSTQETHTAHWRPSWHKSSKRSIHTPNLPGYGQRTQSALTHTRTEDCVTGLWKGTLSHPAYLTPACKPLALLSSACLPPLLPQANLAAERETRSQALGLN